MKVKCDLPCLLSVLDYYDIVKNPIDLQGIRQKLVAGQYEDPLECCNDVWLMFDKTLRKKRSKAYKDASTVRARTKYW